MINTDTTRYISSDLRIIEREKGKGNNNPSNNQLVIDNKVYAALTPDVYVWLRQRMEKAHLAFKSGKLLEKTWNILRERFYPVHDCALETWGEDVIAQSMNK